jgi:hypothetical protein
LCEFIPELANYKSHVSETVTVELRDALLDFFEQMGQTRDDHLRRLIMVGGDRLTYDTSPQEVSSNV